MKKIYITVYSLVLLLSVVSRPLYSAAEKDLMLNVIGGLSAQGIYLTYVSIGSLVDGHVHKAYKDDFTRRLMDEYIALSNHSKKLLTKLVTSGILTENDNKFVNDLLTTYDILIAEAAAYKNYIDTGSKDQINVYEFNRKEAWKRISKLLNLK